MVVQNIQCIVQQSSVQLTWVNIQVANGITIQFATNIFLNENLRTFIFPFCTSASLSIGTGTWYFRIGSIAPDGKIGYSPVCGPVTLTEKSMIHEPPEDVLRILHTKQIANGIRLQTGHTSPLYAVLDVSKDRDFSVYQTKSYIVFDTGKGYFDTPQLDPEHTYMLRISCWSGDRSKLPTCTIEQLHAGQIVVDVRPGLPVKALDNTDRAINRADQPVLREAHERPFMRFASHADYLRYQASKAKSSR